MSLDAGIALAERGVVPLPLLRRAVRRLCEARRLDLADAGGIDAFLTAMADAPVADVPALANAQHYELPASFFQLVLGRHLKYSSGHWGAGVRTLDAAEEAMLALSAQRARLEDGQDILELGCGWGSLTAYMARQYPRARIVAVSNSRTQREFLEAHDLPNVTVITADMNDFTPGRRFDRVVSVEMFEHMRNWRTLFGRVAGWLVPDGRAFIHVFCHARDAYPFATDGAANWMGRHFFSGGIMPAFDLLPRVLEPDGMLGVEERWWVDGRHYQRTARAWREHLEARRGRVLGIFRTHYGADAARWYHRWRLFFLACEELFGYADGTEWGVGHYRLRRV